MATPNIPARDNPASAIGRAALVAAIAVGGTLAVAAIADYLAQQRAGRVGVGTGAGVGPVVEAWLRQTAERLERGSREILESVDSTPSPR